MPDQARCFGCGAIPVPCVNARPPRRASWATARIEIVEARRVYHLGDAKAAAAAEGARDTVQDELPADAGRIPLTAMETNHNGVRAVAAVRTGFHGQPQSER